MPSGLRRVPLLHLCIAALAMATVAFAASADARPKPEPSYFGSREIRRDDLKPFPKWTGALQRHFEERKEVPGDCQETLFNRCHFKRWQALLDGLRDADLMQQVTEINTFMNRARYIVDPINWGVKDYWASPHQFLRKKGDCEDYAIAKFLSLRALGVGNDQMRIVVLQDLNLRTAHAVLVVFIGDQTLVLDNQIRQVVKAETIHHYRPIYSVNEEAWWLHRR